jgi:hypothetical protein
MRHNRLKDIDNGRLPLCGECKIQIKYRRPNRVYPTLAYWLLITCICGVTYARYIHRAICGAHAAAPI